MPDLQHFRFFVVRAQEARPDRKTLDYSVVQRLDAGGERLGTIRWYGPWRQYCFFPEPDTVWSAGCLADVQTAIARIAQRRRR